MSKARNGKVSCPEIGSQVTEIVCAKCRYLRIAEYSFVKCLYKAIKAEEDKK